MTAWAVAPDPPGAAGQRLALVVAVTDYTDPSLRRLRAPAGDAAALGALLSDPDIGGFSVTTVFNEEAQTIRLAVEDFLAERRPDDLLLLYLSCHGLVDLRRRLYFAAANTVKTRLAATGVEAHWLLEQLEDCRARRQVVILDCCFSGAFAQGAKGSEDLGIGERLVGQGRGRVVLTASRGTEYSFEGEPVPGGQPDGSVFTGALVQGIRSGAADADGDGLISVDDAYAYAFDEVRRAGAQQTPQRWLYGAEGDIILARNPAAGTETRLPRPVAPAPAASRVPPDQVERPTQTATKRSKRRVAVLAAAAAGVAGILIASYLLLRSGGAGTTLDPSLHSATGTLEATAPWRLVVRDDMVQDVGCDVTLTNVRSGWQQQWNDLYGKGLSFQIHQSGSFRWRVNDRACLVVKHSGAGRLKLPFAQEYDNGDTDAFAPVGKVVVTVKNFNGSPSCDLTLNAVSGGRPLDFGTVNRGDGPLRLDPQGEPLVYLSNPLCGLEVSDTG